MGSAITPAMADEWNKETRLEISGPLEIPGKVLAPGTYIFKLADSQSDRNIVEIFSEDANGRQKLVTTVLAFSAYSVKTPDKPIIGLDERPSGSPQAIHNWFYPGDNAGWEFIYPKSDRLGVSASGNQDPSDAKRGTVGLARQRSHFWGRCPPDSALLQLTPCRFHTGEGERVAKRDGGDSTYSPSTTATRRGWTCRPSRRRAGGVEYTQAQYVGYGLRRR